MRLFYRTLAALSLAAAAVSSALPAPSKAATTETTSEPTSPLSQPEAQDPVFISIVQNAFGPEHQDKATTYHKTRFFVSHIQAKMHYLITQLTDTPEDDTSESPDDSNERSLTKSEASDLNSMLKEMWIVSRKMYQDSGCLSYDLGLCNNDLEVETLSDGDKDELKRWEETFAVSFVPDQLLVLDDAERILNLTRGVQDVLLSNLR